MLPSTRCDGPAGTAVDRDGGPWWRFSRRRRPLSGQSSLQTPDSSAIEHKEGSGPSTRGWRRYLHLLRTNRNYQLYLCSHFCQHAGDWFVYVASLIAIEELAPGSGTAISILVATKMIPMILLTSFGGALADRFDRRHLMIALDAWNAMIALLYLVALRYESATLLYVVSFVRHAVVALYEPVTRSIVPMLVTSDEDLKYAMTMNGMAWAITLAVGGMFAGWSSAAWGVGACYVMDSATYLVSTVVIWMVRGNFCVGNEAGDDRTALSPTRQGGRGLSRIRACFCRMLCPVTSFIQMFIQLIRYLGTCQFGLLVFLKASGNITWGSADIINVHYAHVDGDEVKTSTNIGLLYSSVGLGCLLGPIAANFFTDMHRPFTLQMVCTAALGFVMAGWLGIAAESYRSIGWLCFFNSVRAFGTSVIWINSTLILQKLSADKVMGRVLSFDFATTMLCDTLASFIVGFREDAGIEESNIAVGASIVAGLLWLFWSLYTMAGNGAARKQFNVSSAGSQHREPELGETGGDLNLVESDCLNPGAIFT